MNNSKFSNFITAFGATKLLLERAIENDFLIEALVLYSSLIDGMCRIGLILTGQIKNKSSKVNQEYIYQADGVYGIPEREIYKRSLKNSFIDKDDFKGLNDLYDFRNKVIHRFFTSEVDYSKIKKFLKKYEEIYKTLYKKVYELESEQIKSGIGMTSQGRIPKTVTEKSRHSVIKKIGLVDKEIVHSLGYATVEGVTEFSRKNKLMSKCKKCGHYKMYHMDINNLKKSRVDKKDVNDLLGKCINKGCNCKKFSKSK